MAARAKREVATGDPVGEQPTAGKALTFFLDGPRRLAMP
jgi:hypothetical protein